jgi:hypothetical protein
MFGISFLRKPAPLRAIVATKAENLLVQRKRADVRLELAVYAATTTPEQRRAEADAFFAAAALKQKRRRRTAKLQAEMGRG